MQFAQHCHGEEAMCQLHQLLLRAYRKEIADFVQVVANPQMKAAAVLVESAQVLLKEQAVKKRMVVATLHG